MSRRGPAMTSKRLRAAGSEVGKPSGLLLASEPRSSASVPPDSDQLLFVRPVAERHASALCIATSAIFLGYRRLGYD